MIFMLDNYDSFTFNLVQRFGEIDPTLEIVVKRNDQTTLAEIEQMAPAGIVISPGPCTPAEAGISRDVIRHFGPHMPLLGVCLGHQSLADVYGAKVVRAQRLMHGMTSMIHHKDTGVFRGLPNPMIATRYHSLLVPEETVPDCLEVTAWTEDKDHPREIMGLQHREYPVHGVQFHPESFLTTAGTDLLRNYLQLTLAGKNR
jgi:anthranilate synthase component 2